MILKVFSGKKAIISSLNKANKITILRGDFERESIAPKVLPGKITGKWPNMLKQTK